MYYGTHTAAQDAAKRKKQEEEEMTKYTRKELNNDWEFKIVRSATGKFSKRDMVEQVRMEESIAGWIMVEKFDDSRIRFKRPFSAQRDDIKLPYDIDPYRTTFGMSEARLAFTIIGIIAVSLGLIALLIFLFQ
jgi:hypothetical protein